MRAVAVAVDADTELPVRPLALSGGGGYGVEIPPQALGTAPLGQAPTAFCAGEATLTDAVESPP